MNLEEIRKQDERIREFLEKLLKGVDYYYTTCTQKRDLPSPYFELEISIARVSDAFRNWEKAVEKGETKPDEIIKGMPITGLKEARIIIEAELRAGYTFKKNDEEYMKLRQVLIFEDCFDNEKDSYFDLLLVNNPFKEGVIWLVPLDEMHGLNPSPTTH